MLGLCRQQALDELEAERQCFTDEDGVIVGREYRVAGREHIAQGIDGIALHGAAREQG